MPKMSSWLRSLAPLLSRHRVFLLCLAVVAVAYTVRSFICRRELAIIAASYRHLPEKGADAFIPHLIESAMMFGYAQDVALGRGLPEYDRRLGGMEHISTWRQFTNGLEYFLGWGYRLKNRLLLRSSPDDPAAQPYEDDPGFTAWARFQTRGWVSLVAGFIFLWLVALRCPLPLALGGGLLYAVAPAAIARYTGQDIVRGTFSLPLVTATFALAAWYLRTPRTWKLVLITVACFLAMATWDMCQIIFGLWALYEVARLFLGGRAGPKHRRLWLALTAAVVLAAVLVPYHREHRLLASPLVLFALPLVIVGQRLAGRPWRLRLPVLLLTALLGIGVWHLAAGGMAENYGHFGNLMAAKLRHGNVKPADPDLLNFDARIIWTPGMHSANRQLLRLFFPLAVYGVPLLLLLGVATRRQRRGLRRRLPWLGLPLLLTVFYFVAFFYIVRYHEFVALFLCVALPLLAYHVWHAARHRRLAMIGLTALLALALWVEGQRTLTNRRSYDGLYFEETAGLIRWLRAEGIAERPVMADFGLGPALKAYCGAKIFLQPQFELPQVRDNYRQFVHEIFLGNPQSLREFCESRGAELLIFDRAWGPQSPLHIYSTRYMAAAKVIPDNAPCVLMSHPAHRRKLRGFYEFKPPPELAFVSRKYLLFKVISSNDYRQAKRYVRDARDARARGDLEHAVILARAAVHADPLSYEARIIYAELFGRAADISPRGY